MKLLLKIKNLFILFVLTLIFLSCEYSNEDINFVEIDKNVNVPKLTSNLDFNSDTIYFRENAYSFWEFKCDKEILNVQFSIDGVSYKDFQNTYSGYLNFEDSFFSNLSYRKLTCTVFVKSGTGSLADKLNAEAIFLKKEWIAVFVPNSFQEAKITKKYRDSLDIVIEYSRYSGPDFEAYYLVKNHLDTIAVAYEQDNLMLKDITYSGEEADYYLITAVKSGAELNRSEAKFFKDYPDFTVSYLGNNSYRISVPINKYSSRISKIQFFEQTSYYDNYNLKFETKNANENNFIINDASFQPEIFYQMTFVPASHLNSLEIPYNLPKYSISLRSMGSDFIDYNSLKGALSPNVYIADTKGNILLYNTNSNKITDTLSSNPGYSAYFGVSASGKKAIINTGKNTFKIINCKDNSTEYEINSGDLPEDVSYTSIAVSDNGFLVYFNYSTIIIYDFINKKVVQKFPVKNKGNYLFISQDGSIVTTETDIYLLKDGYYTYYGNISGEVIAADSENPDLIYYHSFYKLILFNFKTMQEIRSIPINSTFCNIDFDSKTIIYTDNKKLIIKDINTGQITSSLDIKSSSSPYNFRFYNKTLFFQDNSKYILKFE